MAPRERERPRAPVHQLRRPPHQGDRARPQRPLRERHARLAEGRYGNRIGAGKFTLNGKEYTLELNNEPAGIPCALHGGLRGFSLRNWTVLEEIHDEDKVGLVLEIKSPDGEGGYPGNVTVRATLTFDNNNVWHIGWKATTDQATPISLTDHAYWNLDGADSGTTIMGHQLYVNADVITAYGPAMIPTGEFRDVTGTTGTTTSSSTAPATT